MRIAFFADINDNHNQKWVTLLSKRHEIVFFTTENGTPLSKSFVDLNRIKVYPILPNRFPTINIFKKIDVAKKIQTVLNNNHIQVIHSIYSVPYSLWASMVDKDNHIITTYGSDILIDYELKWKKPQSFKQKISFYLLRRLLHKAFRRAKFITSTSDEQQKIIRQFIFNNSKLYIVRTGVDCERFEEIYKNAKGQSDEILILSNRAMRPLYNIDIIIEAFCLFLRDSNLEKIKLVLLNYGTDKEYLNYIENLILEKNCRHKIDIVNNLVFEDLVQYYKKASIIVMIPQSDGTPVTGVESLLSKKPLIMGNLNYDIDLFNEKTIWKLQKNNPISLCNEIKKVLSEDSEEVQKKLEMGYLAAKNVADVNKEVERIEKMYENIIRLNG